MKEIEQTLRRYYAPIARDPGDNYFLKVLIDYVSYVKRQPFLQSFLQQTIADEPKFKSGLYQCWDDIFAIDNEAVMLHEETPVNDFLRVARLRLSVQRIQNYLLEKLSDPVEEQPSRANARIRFDEKSGTLFIGKKKVKFRKFTEQYHTLRLMFENADHLREEWFFSEIGEKIDASKHYSDKDFHNYFAAIKRRVATETGLKDVFITTTQSVSLNPDYL